MTVVVAMKFYTKGQLQIKQKNKKEIYNYGM